MLKNKTVLLVEDSRLIRETTSKTLQEMGCRVLEAEDGVEALKLYDDTELIIDVVLSDLQMPRMDGFELAKYNYENRFLPFVIYTSVDDAKSALSLLEYGVHDYIEKPFKEEQLVSVINNAINRWSIHKEFEGDGDAYAGNLATINFLSRRIELTHANNWIMGKIAPYFSEHECDRFMNFLDEILFNAHEHGNLGISEEEKSSLIRDGLFEQEIERLEKLCDAMIKVSISVLSNQVAVCVSDGGKGFDYERYLDMSEDDILDRISLPNGRGICMAQRYFDSIEYRDYGSTVLLTKRFA